MRSARKLTLKKESLTELATGELGLVAGGSGTTCAVTDQIHPCTNLSVVQPCPTATNPVCDFVSRVIVPCLTDQVC